MLNVRKTYIYKGPLTLVLILTQKQYETEERYKMRTICKTCGTLQHFSLHDGVRYSCDKCGYKEITKKDFDAMLKRELGCTIVRNGGR